MHSQLYIYLYECDKINLSLLQVNYKHTILWDFGVNIPDHDNLEFINDKIREIDETFDLILMVENFQESMVLLKHEICWDYEDLASLRLNSHVDKTKSKIDQSAKEKLKDVAGGLKEKFDNVSEKVGGFFAFCAIFSLQKFMRDIKSRHNSYSF